MHCVETLVEAKSRLRILQEKVKITALQERECVNQKQTIISSNLDCVIFQEKYTSPDNDLQLRKDQHIYLNM